MIPTLQAIADTTDDPRALGALAAALRLVDPSRAVQTGDHRGASVRAGQLVNLYRATGRTRQALALIEETIGHTRAAGPRALDPTGRPGLAAATTR